MGEPVIYIDPQKARELDQIIAKQTPTINIDPQKAYDLDWHLALQKLYYRPEGYYRTAEKMQTACKRARYGFTLAIIKNWLNKQALHQIHKPRPKYIPQIFF